MADLSLNKYWKKWAPTLGGNDALPQPFTFELCCGLTRGELKALERSIDDEAARHVKAAVEIVGPRKDEESLDAWQERLADAIVGATCEALAVALKDFVRMGPETLSIDGKPITTLLDYMKAAAVVADQLGMREPARALFQANSLEGHRLVFSKRPSGGGSSTDAKSVASAGNQTAAR